MANKANIVVSHRARGIYLFNTATVFDVRGHIVTIFLEIVDIFIGALITFTLLSWSGYVSLILQIIVASVDYVDTPGAIQAFGGAFFLFFAYIVLPTILLLAYALQRRENVLSCMARIKAKMVAICLAGCEAGPGAMRDAQLQVQHRAHQVMAELQRYLQHKRPYARHFLLPYRVADASPSDQMYKLSREIGILLRKVHRAIQQLHGAVHLVAAADADQSPPPSAAPAAATTAAAATSAAAATALPRLDIATTSPPTLGNGGDPAINSSGRLSGSILSEPRTAGGGGWSGGARRADRLTRLVTELHVAVEGIVAAKEYHSPVILRAIIRWYAILIMPLLTSAFWDQGGRRLLEGDRLACYTGALSLLTQIAFMVIVDVVTNMEDVFDDSSVDNVSFMELVDHIHTMTTVPDAEDTLPFEVTTHGPKSGDAPSVSRTTPADVSFTSRGATVDVGLAAPSVPVYSRGATLDVGLAAPSVPASIHRSPGGDADAQPSALPPATAVAGGARVGSPEVAVEQLLAPPMPRSSFVSGPDGFEEFSISRGVTAV